MYSLYIIESKYTTLLHSIMCCLFIRSFLRSLDKYIQRIKPPHFHISNHTHVDFLEHHQALISVYNTECYTIFLLTHLTSTTNHTNFQHNEESSKNTNNNNSVSAQHRFHTNHHSPSPDYHHLHNSAIQITTAEATTTTTPTTIITTI